MSTSKISQLTDLATTPAADDKLVIVDQSAGETKRVNVSDLLAFGGSGTVTSVALTVPTGLSVSGSPVTTSGTLAVTLTAGYSIPTTASQTNWDTAYGWGDHSAAGYLTSETSHADVVVDGDFTVNGLMSRTGAGVYTTITDNSANWNTAYGWGDHSTQGYVTATSTTTFTNKSGNISQWTNDSGYLTAETDTLSTVAGRGATTTTKITVGGLVVDGEVEEQQYNLTGTDIDPANGTIQYKTLTANTTFTESLTDGEYVTLMIDDGTGFTVTWPTITWVGGSAPTLETTGYNIIELWQVNSVVYGAYIGAA